MTKFVQKLGELEAVQYLPFSGDVGDAAALSAWLDEHVGTTPIGLAVDPAGTDEHGFRLTWSDGEETGVYNGKPGDWITYYENSGSPTVIQDRQMHKAWVRAE